MKSIKNSRNYYQLITALHASKIFPFNKEYFNVICIALIRTKCDRMYIYEETTVPRSVFASYKIRSLRTFFRIRDNSTSQYSDAHFDRTNITYAKEYDDIIIKIQIKEPRNCLGQKLSIITRLFSTF